MPYSFQGINTMSSALRAFQTQLDTTGNNISNAETAGYHRRTVTLLQAPETTVTVGKTVSIGNGVNVAAVSRVRDMFLAGRQAEATSKLGRQQEALTGLSSVQSSMMEPGDDGISAAYDAFNNSWSALSASPGDLSAKAGVQAAGQNLVRKVTGLANALVAQRGDNAATTKDILGKIDAATSKIADLNTQIATSRAHGGTPNDLLDARDATVLELSNYADVSVSQGDGNVSASIDGFPVITPSGATTISDKYDANSGAIVQGNSTYPVTGGSLAGAHYAALKIDSVSTRLNAFADTVRSQVNSLFATGKTANGAVGGTFFANPAPPQTSVGAADLRLSDAVAADPSNIASGTSGLAGDGTLAAQISALRDAKVASLGNLTMGAYYGALVGDVGQEVASNRDAVDTQTSVLHQIDAQISSTDGVSMDDEMANLLRFQRAYQAAAKALSTFDSMSETIINMLNR